MAFPGRGAHEFERRLLDRPGNEEAVDDLDGTQPFQDGSACGQRADTEAG